MLNNYQYCIHLNFKNQELTVLIFFFLKEKMAASIFKEMFIMNTFKVLIISFCNGRIDHLAVVNAIFFIMIFHPGIGKYTVCKILFHLIFADDIFTCEEITSSHIITGQIKFRCDLMAAPLSRYRYDRFNF